MLVVVRDPDFTALELGLPACVIGIGAFGGVYYWGVGSPVAAMINIAP